MSKRIEDYYLDSQGYFRGILAERSAFCVPAKDCRWDPTLGEKGMLVVKTEDGVKLFDVGIQSTYWVNEKDILRDVLEKNP